MFPEWYRDYERSRRIALGFLLGATAVVGSMIFGLAIVFAGR